MPFPAGAAENPAEGTMWVCAGYFEKSMDRAEASYGIRNYRERFLATRKGAVRRAVFVFPVAYRVMRDHLRSQTAARFGEAGFEAFDAFDLRHDVAAARDDAERKPAGMSLKPGDQFAALPDSGLRLDGVPAARIATRPFNGVPSRKGWSELTLMAFDGGRLLGVDSTLVVAWRYDSAEEWGTGKSGSLLDFGRHRTGATYVTSTEFALMERLKKLYSTPFAVFGLSSEGPLSKDAATLDAARTWLGRYEDDPAGKDLQAVNPGRC